jgi:hypothetical protein
MAACEYARTTRDFTTLIFYSVIDARAGGHVVEREQPNATPPGVWYEMKDRAYIRFLLPTVHTRIQASIVGELETNFAASAAIEMVGYYE